MQTLDSICYYVLTFFHLIIWTGCSIIGIVPYMAGGRILAICQSQGEFVTNSDGTMSYTGGEAHAIDIDRDMQLKDLKSEISSMFHCREETFSIKYFLPNNKRTLITVSTDKDLQRMVDFHGDSLTTDIYVVKVMKKVENRCVLIIYMSSFCCQMINVTKTIIFCRKTKSVVADSDTRTEITIAADANTCRVLEAAKRQRVCDGWDNLITGVGQVFDSIKQLREALHKYAIANTFGYRFVKNESQRLTAECTTEGCPWRIHASKSSSTQEFVIKKWNETHTCGRKAGEERNRLANQRWVASMIKEKLRESPDYRPKDIANDLQREYGVSINYTQAWRGKFFAKQELHNSHKEACSQLPWLCERILDTNPGSVATLETSGDSQFSLFIAFHASLNGFEHGCRPLLFLDEISLKASKQWKILAANAVDGENSIFPVAFSVVDAVTCENWHWFLLQLKSALSTSRTITFISNRRNGLEEDVTQVFEGSCHGYCIRHLEKDFMAKLEETELTLEVKDTMIGDLKKCVHTCKVDEFNDYVETIKAESKELADWILAAKPELWSNAFFKGLRYDSHSSDASQIFNTWVISRYEPSVVQIIDMIRCKMMEMIYTRRESSNSWREILTPSMNQKIQKEIAKARKLDVICSTGSVFEVHDDANYVVNVETWECTCRRWQVTGMPCLHALAVLDRTDGCVSEFCSKYFTTECYRMVYSLSVIPIPDAGRPGRVVPMNLGDVIDMSPRPRRGRRPAGRPKEKPDDPRITLKRAIRCGKCQGLGHNKQTCKTFL